MFFFHFIRFGRGNDVPKRPKILYPAKILFAA
jgi:hypothetical protein